MVKQTITIEEIKANPNLDLSERIRMLAQEGKWIDEQMKELALASIQQDYEFWVVNREIVSQRTDDILLQILNGRVLNKTETFEMVCDDKEKVNQYSRYEDLRMKIADNNGITIDDFNELCKVIGIDSATTELIGMMFASKGLIVESYKAEDSHNK